MGYSGMAFHHVAIAARDLEATHRFYTEAMGFDLVTVEVVPYPANGWARHLFYDTGNGEMLAIWDINSEAQPSFDPAISTGLGLPNFVNHIAFASGDLDDLDARKDRWLAQGHDVVKIDHGWCTSIYANDPNGIMVEFCCTTRAMTDDDRRRAQDLLAAANPPINKTDPPMEFFEAKSAANAGVS
jgi:catechol 2,3-dioxygenase-like lactoylglutathione lyase family enzyme